MIRRWEPQYEWQRVADALRDRVKDGTYRPQGRMPAIHQIQDEYGVGRNTALHAIRSLVEEGWLVIKPKIGTYVRPREEWPTSQDET
ncbi:winged helix-turn-helix domain-containing protein [Nonomuraea typhae]|uniref:winged helix-turn-helix domain-containing protein n=1 Tax=Nonomuraea typhae TaxID=2603600 RepID=UPI0012FCE71F|nr:winged helix-turn-helix domain-containing protein [Nonomuraea typhae]